MLRRTRALLVSSALASLALAGCPRELQPPPPGDAATCMVLADCNEGRTCGALSLCVGDGAGATGYCEREPSLAVPCPEDGVPVPAPGDPDIVD